MAFDLESEIRKATEAYFATEGIAIPVSVRSPSASLTGWPIERPVTECWECGATLGPGRHYGPYNYCAQCRAALRREAMEARND